MIDQPSDPRAAHLTDRALADKLARTEREAVALRANLRKRKDQVRAREVSPPALPEPHEV